MLDSKTVRGIVLAIIRAYRDINEVEFEETMALLQSAPDEKVRYEASEIMGIWFATKDQDALAHPRVVRYRLKLIDEGIQRLEVLTRLKEQNA